MSRKIKREQFSVLTAPYLHHSLEYAFASIAANGFSKVELWAASPHYCMDDNRNQHERDIHISKILRSMEEKGLTMSAFHPEQHRQYPYNIASPNAHIRKTSIEHMKAYVEDTASFECNRMILCPGWEVLDKRDEDNRKRSVEAIQIISEKAEEFGVTLYMEEMATIHSCFTDSMIKLYDLFKSIGRENVKPCYDSYMASLNHECFEEYQKLFGDIDYIHFSDSNEEGYTALGAGNEPLESFLKKRADEKYEGTFSISLWGGGYYKDPDVQLRKTTDFLRYSDSVV